jgi:hypothetical protein
VQISTDFNISKNETWMNIEPANCLGAYAVEGEIQEENMLWDSVVYITLSNLFSQLKNCTNERERINQILREKMPTPLRLMLLQAMTKNRVNVLMGVSGSGKTYSSLQFANYYDVIYFTFADIKFQQKDIRSYTNLLAKRSVYDMWNKEQRELWCDYYSDMFQNLIYARMIALYHFKSKGNTSYELALAQHNNVDTLMDFSLSIFESFREFKVNFINPNDFLCLNVKLVLDEFQDCYRLMPNAFSSTNCTKADGSGRCISPKKRHERSLAKAIISACRQFGLHFFILGTGISLNNVLEYTSSAAGVSKKANEDATFVISDFDFITTAHFKEFFEKNNITLDYEKEETQSILEMMSGRAR